MVGEHEEVAVGAGLPRGPPPTVEVVGEPSEERPLGLPEDVVVVELTGAVKTVELADGSTHRAEAIILATGSGYRRLGTVSRVFA